MCNLVAKIRFYWSHTDRDGGLVAGREQIPSYINDDMEVSGATTHRNVLLR